MLLEITEKCDRTSRAQLRSCRATAASLNLNGRSEKQTSANVHHLFRILESKGLLEFAVFEWLGVTNVSGVTKSEEISTQLTFWDLGPFGLLGSKSTFLTESQKQNPRLSRNPQH